MISSRLFGWLLLALPVAAIAVVNPPPQTDEAVQAVAPDVDVTEPTEPLSEQEAQVVDPKGSDPLEEPLTCLARSIYWEAKGVPGRLTSSNW